PATLRSRRAARASSLRVSSAATTSASTRRRRSRGEASATSPIGVAARTREPVMRQACHGVGPSPTMASVSAAAPSPAWDPVPDAPEDPRSTHERLLAVLLGERALRLGTTASDRLWGWLGPALVAVVAAVLRFWHLG